MRFRTNPAAALAALALVSCAADVDPEGQSANVTDDFAYAFELPREGDTLKTVDAMGVALTSTVLMNRDRTPFFDEKDAAQAGETDTAGGISFNNQYQEATPNVHLHPKVPLIFLHYLRALHKHWGAHLKSLGYDICSKVGPVTGALYSVTPCTLQRILHKDPDGSFRKGPRVIDAVLPDYITLDLNERLGFPNGRYPAEPISDKVVAMGLIDMTKGGECMTATGGKEQCHIETFVNLPLQVPKNDRPFATEFPYLAKPWYYQDGQASWFWPTTPRLETAE